MAAWTPILRGYAGGLLDFCTQVIALSQDVVAGWLEKHMLAHDDAGVPAEVRAERAKDIAAMFGSEESYARLRTHGRPIRVEELEQVDGLRIRRLEADDGLQDIVLTIYHALDLTFGGPAVKIVENHLGNRKVRAFQPIVVQQGPPPGPGGAMFIPTQPPPGSTPTHPDAE